MDIVQLNMEQEEQDGILASIVLHLAIFLLFFIPWLGKKIIPPESITGISVVFETPIEETEYTPIVDAPAPQSPKAAKTAPPASQEEAQSKEIKEEIKENSVEEEFTKIIDDVTESTKETIPAEVESETVTDESAEVSAAEAKAKQAAEDAAKLKAKQEAEAAAKLKAQKEAEAAEAARIKANKEKFGSLFGSGGGSSTAEESTDIGGSNSGELDAISNGNGGSGGGLTGRGITYKPTFADNSDREGRVVVQICVNSSGGVISTEFVQSGSTTTDEVLINKALTGAKKYKFEVNPSINKQCGEITIDFEVR